MGRRERRRWIYLFECKACSKDSNSADHNDCVDSWGGHGEEGGATMVGVAEMWIISLTLGGYSIADVSGILRAPADTLTALTPALDFISFSLTREFKAQISLQLLPPRLYDLPPSYFWVLRPSSGTLHQKRKNTPQPALHLLWSSPRGA